MSLEGELGTARFYKLLSKQAKAIKRQLICEIYLCYDMYEMITSLFIVLCY